MYKRRWAFFIVSSMVLLNGCNLSSTTQLPTVAAPTHWYAAPKDTAEPNNEMPGWRAFFQDPQLRKWIELALHHNADYQIVALNVAATRAQYDIQQAQQFPAINASANASRSLTAADASPTGQPLLGNNYAAGIGFTAFELDLFGRIRNLKDAALAKYLASEEAQRSAKISLIGTVANAYLSTLADQAQLALLEQTLHVQQQVRARIQRKLNIGAATALDLIQAETVFNTAQSAVAALKRQRAQNHTTLELLVGQPIPPTHASSLAQTQLVSTPPPHLPATLLARRPDIQSAEYDLRAADADIGAARAAFFPAISLTGEWGRSSTALHTLFRAPAKTWGIASGLTLPIFNAGRLRANLKLSKIQRDVRVVQYQKAVQTAFKEVNDALTAQQSFDEQLQADEAAVATEQKRLHLSTKRFDAGLDNYLSVLDTQRQLLSAQQTLIRTHAARLMNRVTLYKVLGGGWQE